MNSFKRITAGVISCLLLFTGAVSPAFAETLPGRSEEKEGYNRHEKTVVVENIYEQDELKYDDMLTVPTQTGLFKTEDVKYSLVDIVWEDMTITNRSIELKSTTDYGFVTGKPTAPSVRVAEFTDIRSGKTLEARLELISLDLKDKYKSEIETEVGNSVLDNAIVNAELDKLMENKEYKSQTEEALDINDSYGWAWRNDLVIPLKATLTGEYLKFHDIYIPYNVKQPTYSGYEEVILKSLGLNTNNYRITGSHWNEETVLEDGVEVRYGSFTGERYSANYTAVYEGKLALPDVEGYRATLIYEAYTEKDYVTPIALGTGGFVAIAVPAALLFFKRRKRNEVNRENNTL